MDSLTSQFEYNFHLEPLDQSHTQGLINASSDPRIWTYSSLLGDPGPHQITAWLAHAFAENATQTSQVWVVVRKSDRKIVGSSRFYQIAPEHKRLAIGFTWFSPEVWGTSANPEVKLLMLTHAFETLQYHRVEFHVDSRNLRSMAALKKLDVQPEGILRHHMIIQDGYVRDTVVHSVIHPEWSHVRQTLWETLKKKEAQAKE